MVEVSGGLEVEVHVHAHHRVRCRKATHGQGGVGVGRDCASGGRISFRVAGHIDNCSGGERAEHHGFEVVPSLHGRVVGVGKGRY